MSSSSVQFIGCGPNDALIPGRYYRVGFTKGALGVLLVDSGVDIVMRKVYNAIASSTDVVPTTQYTRAPGQNSLVVDCKAVNHATTTCADLANAIDKADAHVNAATVELLPGAPSVAAPAERQSAADNLDNTKAVSLPGLGFLSSVGDDVKYALLAVAFVAAVMLFKDAQEWT